MMTTSKLNSRYPRPDFERSALSWKSLDGEWDFAYDDDDQGVTQTWFSPQIGIPKKCKRKIAVPFVYQTAASGINEQDAHPIVWYQTSISYDGLLSSNPGNGDQRLLLRFGAVDYEATVWLDGAKIGTHRGGHVPFEFDVGHVPDDKSLHLLTLRVYDGPTDLTQPRGKQYWGPKPEGIFYTPSTGIWQSVWLEAVPNIRIADSSHGTFLRSNDIDSGELDAEIAVLGPLGSKVFARITASIASGSPVTVSEPVEVHSETALARLRVPLRLTEEQVSSLSSGFLDTYPSDDKAIWHNNLPLWSPEHPVLYDIMIDLLDSPDSNSATILDQVKTTTGMRSISWDHNDGTLRLNNVPYFHALVLDQGYWPNTNMTPPTSTSCYEDILLSKSMGFNGCRKHQKVEDPLFLYCADRLGYLVWGEMGNAYEFSTQYADRFDQEWKEMVKRDINHPCIVAWTPINETWGYGDLKGDATQQTHIRSLYYQTKTLDSTRPINDNCGWEHVVTDLSTFHDYSDGPELTRICHDVQEILKPHGGRDMFVGGAEHRTGAPVICTEFGGVNIALKDGDNGVDGEWGYTTATDSKDLLERVKRLMLGVVEGGHCCGFVYTQLTDIEQETNGLYTFDRKEKLPAAEVKQIIDEARRIYFEKSKALQ